MIVRRAVAPLALAAAFAAGCSSGSGPKQSPGSGLPQVTGAVGQKAVITLPSGVAAPAKLETRTLVQGSGATLVSGQLAAVNYTVVNWTGDKALGDTYSADGGKTPNQPQVVTLGSTGLLPAWNTALTGARIGSRIEIVAPPADAFGSQGNAQAGVGPKDDLVFVLDVIGGYEASADITGKQATQAGAGLPTVAGDPGGGNPKVTIPAGAKPPASLVADTLIHGSGEAVQSGRTLLMQYTGVDWNTGKNFDSSFTRKQAFSTTIGAGKVIKGWDDGLVGKHVGDRVLLVIPPSLGYGPSGGQSSAGIGANDTLVFVVDIVDAL
ncbi:FKBP-type peptidyl-prolyl cis-trans isomerase [Actinocrinis puniceicyclus]|uniref:peptidylprolyl isomerase n=1 Tax=Actinocrinis puniceicyclus TaxID=977794 RepID=A0A8J7WGD6_9ACTN|nr:FKBP-type peptidyl-prolyl cis-trans isomerase [Actinocrinis puniceicyclus]MBS2961631.1 FKBP-type peptidyl-prolyl cis-trans isomerase [Actinocrinis puniceicyclus]